MSESVNFSVAEQLIKFKEEESIKEKISILCCISRQDIEDLGNFSDVLTEAPKMFDALLESLQSVDKDSCNVRALVENDLQLSCQLLQSVTLILQNSKGAFVVNDVSDVLGSVVDILMKAYYHCKDSDVIYGDFLVSFSECLGIFYNKISLLLKSFIICLDKLILSRHNEEVFDLIFICDKIVSLCQLICSLDDKTSAALWKSYTKLIIRFVDDLKNELDIGKALIPLSSYIIEKVKWLTSFIENEQKQVEGFEDSVKLSSLHMKLIITICNKFEGYIGDCLEELFQLILQLYELSIKCYTCSFIMYKEAESIHNFLIVGVEPLILQLKNERDFLQHLHKISISDDNQLLPSLCLLKISVLDKMPDKADDMEAHYEEHTGLPILNNLFKELKLCPVETFYTPYLPGVMCQGKPYRTISFYEYLVIHLSAFVSKCCSCHFHNLEVMLINTLLSGEDILSCLICDIWCFLVRYGSDELCFNHCMLFARLMLLIKEEKKLFWIKFLFRRLTKFISTEQKVQLYENFPYLCIMVPKKATTLLVNRPVTLCSSLLEAVPLEKDLSELQSLLIHKMYCLQELGKQLQNTEMDTVQLRFYSCILEIASAFVHKTKGKLLLDLLQFSYIMWSTKNDLLQIQVISFLKHWSRKNISACPEQRQIFKLLATLIAQVLCSEHYILQHESLCVFSELAHLTPHKEIIKECLKKSSEIKNNVKEFLNKGSISNSLSDKEIKAILKQQEIDVKEMPTSFKQKIKEYDKNLVNLSIVPTDEVFDNEGNIPSGNDDFMENKDSEVYRLLENIMESAEKLKYIKPIPVRAAEKIKSVCHQLNELL